MLRLITALIMLFSSSVVWAGEQEEAHKQPVQKILVDKLNAIAPLVNEPVDSSLFDITDIIAVNDAERYLLFIITGARYLSMQQYQDAILNFKLAEEISPDLNDEQLARSHFRVKNLLMSHTYTLIDDYDKAFAQKRAYLFKYFDDENSLAQQQTIALEKKYQIEQIEEQKKLLQEQRHLHQLQLAKVKSKEAEHERDIIIIVIVTILFVLLLMRQLTIRKRLVQLTQIDSLTKVNNRDSLFSIGQKLFAKAQQQDENLSAIVIDIKAFHQINERYGLVAGDKVLKSLARLIKEVMRARDVLARTDGGKFAALLPQASIGEAKAIVARINDKVAQRQFAGIDDRSAVSLSIGVAAKNTDIDNIDLLIQAANRAACQANSQTCSSVVVAEEALT